MSLNVFTTNFPPQNTPAVDSKGTITNAFMAFFRDLYNRTGAGTGLVNQVNLNVVGNILADWNLATGNVTLPELTGGQAVVVQSAGGPVVVTAPINATIDGSGTFNLGAGKMQIFWFFSDTQIFSTQL